MHPFNSGRTTSNRLRDENQTDAMPGETTLEAKADPDTQFEVDVMTLDYFTCNAFNAILWSRTAEREGQAHDWDAASLLSLSSKFEYIFSTTHSTAELPRDLTVKLQLLHFANLFFRRYKAEDLFIPPISLRGDAVRRLVTRAFPDSSTYRPLDIHSHSRKLQLDTNRLDENYCSRLLQLKISPDSARSRADLIPLASILPEFIDLCTLAAISGHEDDAWCRHLLSCFTSEALFEAYLVFGDAPLEPFDMFFARTPMEPYLGELWISQRNDYIRYLRLQEGVPKRSKGRSAFRLESLMTEFLNNLMSRLKEPAFVQLERGEPDVFNC